MDSTLSGRSVMLSLTGYFTDVAADAEIVVYEQAILCHSGLLLPIDPVRTPLSF
jgi:hypothetical protein